MAEKADVSEGDEVEIEYRSEVGLDPMERDTIQTTVTGVCGEILYLDNPFGMGEPTLVLDPENTLWARDERGRDGLFGSNARLV